jgi:hypothetical protein
LSVPKISKAVAARKINKLMFQLTHLSFKIFPNGTAFDAIFIDYPIFNRNIVNGITNMIPATATSFQRAPRELPESTQRALSLQVNYSSLELIVNIFCK